MRRSRVEWRLRDGEWQLVYIAPSGEATEIASGSVRLAPDQAVNLRVNQEQQELERQLTPGYHAVVVRPLEGTILCDGLESTF